VDVVIIGAGIVGCSIAFALSKRGLSTLNIDKLPAAGYGSTSHSSAIIRPIYSHVTSCAVAHEARCIWQEWRGFLGIENEEAHAVYTECGGLVLVREGEENAHDANLAAMKEVGIEYSYKSATELGELFPGISLESYGPPRPIKDPDFGQPSGGRISAGIYVPHAGYVNDPQLATRNLQSAAQANGAEFRFNSKIEKILRDDQGVSGVELNHGETVNASIVINAAGPHSGSVNDLAGIRQQLAIDTKPLRHEVVYLAAPPSLTTGSMVIFDVDAGVYQRPDGVDVVIGSTDPACDPLDIVDPDHYNQGFTDQWTLQAHRSAQRFPDLGIANTARGTVGIYDLTPDWIPIYDKSNLPGFYMSIGTSGNQFKNAPLIGEVMAEIIELGMQGIDHDQAPALLHLTHLDRSVSLDFYSRNRELQSTGSVMA